MLALWLLLALPAAAGLLRLEVDASGDAALDRADPAWAFYQRSKRLFGGDELLVVALRGERPYDPELLARVARLSAAFERIPGVRRVDSLATVPLIRVGGPAARRGAGASEPSGTLELEALLERPHSDWVVPSRAAALLAPDRIAPGSLVSRDGRTVALNLLLESGYTRGHEALLEAVRARLDGSAAWVSGVPTFRVATNRYTQSEILLFSPATAALLLGLLAACAGRVRSALAALVPGLTGTAVALGAMGWLRVPLGITTLVLPPVLIAFGCAYSLHALLAVARRPEASLRSALATVSGPVWISGITTALGFTALALGRIELVTQLGAFGALGVVAATAAAASALPALLALFPGTIPRRRLDLGGASARVLAALAGRRGLVLGSWAAVALAGALGLPHLRVDTDLTRWLPRGNPIRDDYEAIRAELSGISPVNVVVDLPAGASVLDPRTLEGVDGLAAHLEAGPGVGKALSVADPLRQLHGALTGDPRQPLPGSRALAEQYLLLLESVEPLRDVIAPGGASANVVLRVDDNSSRHLLSLDHRARRWWRENVGEDAAVGATGLMYEYARAEQAISEGQLRGLVAAVGSIAAVLLLTVARPRRAALALLPNLAPLLLLFGAMGWLGIALDVGTALVATLALGIAVDDTVHLLAHYDRARARGLDGGTALRQAFECSLAPLAATTAIVGLAFGVFAFSEFSLTRNLGLLTASIMVVCLAADLTLLGAALAPGERRA